MAIDIEKREPVLSNIYGGLSGPAIKPVALAMVHKVSKAVNIPVIGIGGIMNEKDALEFLIAGATAIQVGSANFVDPAAAGNVVKGINKYMKANKIYEVKKIIKTLKY